MRTPDNTSSLPDLYRYLSDGSEHDKRRARAAIGLRSRLAAEILACDAALMDPLSLADQLERLRLVSQPETPEGRAEAEVINVQVAVLERERQRRVEAENAPLRTEVTAALVRLGGDMDRDPTGDARGTLRALASRACDAYTNALSAADATADILDVAMQAGEDGKPMDGWGWTAILLEVLTNPRAGMAGVRFELDAVSEAEAVRAKRLFWGHTRQDPRYEGIDWPCDLTPQEVGRIVRTAAAAHAEWANLHLPESDLEAYRAPCRAEERDRPDSGEWVVDGYVAQQEAEAAGGITVPVVLPLHPTRIAEASRRVWTNGVTIEPRDGAGISLFSAPDDSRVRWDGPPILRGLICAVVVKPEEILAVGRDCDMKNEQLLEGLGRVLGEEAGTDEEYAALLREGLLERGFVAVVRYDHVIEETPHPDEIVLLDTSPERLRVIRNAVPSFMSPMPPIRVPGNQTLSAMPAAPSRDDPIPRHK